MNVICSNSTIIQQDREREGVRECKSGEMQMWIYKMEEKDLTWAAALIIGKMAASLIRRVELNDLLMVILHHHLVLQLTYHILWRMLSKLNTFDVSRRYDDSIDGSSLQYVYKCMYSRRQKLTGTIKNHIPFYVFVCASTCLKVAISAEKEYITLYLQTTIIYHASPYMFII